jgi:hypothetical protein
MNFLKPTLFEKIQKKSWELKNSVTNSLQNRAIKKVIWEISSIVTRNLTFNFNPRKTDFSLKKSQNQKKSYKWKNLTESSLQNRCIKKYYTWSWDIDAHSLKNPNFTDFGTFFTLWLCFQNNLSPIKWFPIQTIRKNSVGLYIITHAIPGGRGALLQICLSFDNNLNFQKGTFNGWMNN